MPELFIEHLEPLDEIGDLLSRIRSTRLGAEVGATAEGTVLVDGATPVRSEQGTGTFGMRLHGRTTRGAHSLGRVERFRFRHLRRPPGEPEMATARAQQAITMGRTSLDRRIDRAQFGDRLGIKSRA